MATDRSHRSADRRVRPGRLGWAAALAAMTVEFVLYRRWHQRWGATDAEVGMPLPGDDLVSQPEFHATRAVTIDAPPEAVWPWIVQMGYGRAGFYAYDLLDNLGRPSADRIVAEWQDPKIGDWIAMSGNVNDNTAFRVQSFEPNRWMLWAKPGSTWLWSLQRIGQGETRLVVRLKAKYRWTRPTILADLFLMELGDFPMMRHALLSIRRRATASIGGTRVPAAG
jgi:hypothetical protein